jgi:hypothetical protein
LAASFLIQALAGVLAAGAIVALQVGPVGASVPQLLVVTGLTLTGFTIILYAFATEDASTVGPVLGLKVIFVALLESVLQWRAVPPGVATGAVVSLVGIALISQTDHWSLRPRDLLRPGILLMGVAGLAFAVSDMFVRRGVGLWGGPSAGLHFGLYSVLLSGACAVVALALLRPLRPALQALRLGGEFSWAAARGSAGLLSLNAVTILLFQVLFIASLGVGQLPTVSNILYNTRSLFIVALMAFLVLGRGSTVERAGGRAYLYRTGGVALTLSAVALALVWR